MVVRSIFLAGPFKALVDPVTGAMRPAERARIESVIDRLERDGYEVRNAHRREAWGEQFLTPDECTRLDFDDISECDVFVAFPGAPASPGTHVEIGWASALGKPVVLLEDIGATYAFLVRGLHTVGDVTHVPVRPGSDVTEEVVAALRTIEARPAGAPEPVRPSLSDHGRW